MVDSHVDLVKKAIGLSDSHKLLTAEASLLETHRDQLNCGVHLSRKSLGLAFRQLPALVDVLARQNPPAVQRAKLTSSFLSLIWPSSETSEVLSIYESRILSSTLQSLNEAESAAKESKKQATCCGIKAADLASQASRQEEECSSIFVSISAAMRETRSQIEKLTKEISLVQSKVRRDRNWNCHMKVEAEDRDRRIDKHIGLFLTTFWIPGVNLVTIPLSVGRSVHHGSKIEEFQQLAASYESSIAKGTAQCKALETQNAKIEEAHSKLCGAADSCSDIAKQSTQLKEKAMELVDQHSVISEQSRAISDALEMFNNGVQIKLQDWSRLRLRAMQGIAILAEQVQERNLLDVDDTSLSVSRVKIALTRCGLSTNFERNGDNVINMAV